MRRTICDSSPQWKVYFANEQPNDRTKETGYQ